MSAGGDHAADTQGILPTNIHPIACTTTMACTTTSGTTASTTGSRIRDEVVELKAGCSGQQADRLDRLDRLALALARLNAAVLSA